MIVETQKHGECTCHFDDSAYIQKTQEEVDSVLCMFSAFILDCVRKKKTA